MNLSSVNENDSCLMNIVTDSIEPTNTTLEDDNARIGAVSPVNYAANLNEPLAFSNNAALMSPMMMTSISESIVNNTVESSMPKLNEAQLSQPLVNNVDERNVFQSPVNNVNITNILDVNTQIDPTQHDFGIKHQGGIKMEQDNETNNENDDNISLDITSCEAFHKKLFKIHFGTDDLGHAATFLNNEISYISQIQDKMNQRMYISPAESLALTQSRYYALFMAQIQMTFFNNNIKDDFKDLDVKHLRMQFSFDIIQQLYKNIQCFWKLWFKDFVCANNDLLLLMETSQNEISLNRLNKNIYVQLSDNDNDKYPTYKAFLEFLKTMIPSDWNAFLTNSVCKILKHKNYNLPQLNWNEALINGDWKSLFAKIMLIPQYSHKKYFRLLLLKIIAQSSKAMYKLITMSLMHYELLIKNLPDTGPWHHLSVWTAVKFALAVWPQIIKHYLCLSKFGCVSDLDSWERMGSITFYFGCMGMWGMYDPLKWTDDSKFVGSIIPLDYYGLKSTISQWYSPKCFNTVNVIDKQYNNGNQNDNHWTIQHTPLCFAYIVAAFSLHYNKLGQLYGVGIFDEEYTFQCDAFNGDNVSDAVIKKAFDKFVVKSINESISEQDEKEIVTTFLTLSNTKLDTYNMDTNCILSKFCIKSNKKSSSM